MSLPSKEAMYAEVGKFTRNFTLLTLPAEVAPEHDVPDAWVEMLRSQEAGKKTWAEPWEPFREILPCVLDFLEQRVQCVCVLLRANLPPMLLYFYSRDGADYYYYEGGPALGDTAPDDPRRIWARLPPKLQAFIETCIMAGQTFPPWDHCRSVTLSFCRTALGATTQRRS